MQKTGPTNPLTTNLVRTLKKTKKNAWKDVAARLEKSTRSRIEVNLSRIERNANSGEMIVVPGKVLGTGAIQKKVAVAALSFSAQARQKIMAAGGECFTLTEMVKKDAEGKNIRIMG